MQITPVAQDNAFPQAASVVPKQDTQPAPAPQKDTVELSQAAKDLAAQATGTTVQEEAKESPAVATQEAQAKAAK